MTALEFTIFFYLGGSWFMQNALFPSTKSCYNKLFPNYLQRILNTNNLN